MIFLYNILFPILFLCYLPFYAVHFIRRGGLTVDFWERFGIFPKAIKKRLAALKAPVWIHAVSVGETVAAVSFIQMWLQRHPDEEFVFSCGTSTGFATARQKLPAQVVAIYCPIDCWWMIHHTFKLVHPRLLGILEVEIWPNLILQAKKFGAKLVLINGRLSDNSSRGYAKWGFFFRKLFRAYDALCIQTPEDQARLERVIGEDHRIHTVGTVKFDQVPDRTGADLQIPLAKAFGTRPVKLFCVGSTHPGEEELICQAFAKLLVTHTDWRMVLVPRHAERAAEVIQILDTFHLHWHSIQPVPNTIPAADGDCQVLLVNTTGQLMNYYQVADLCYVGKSLAGQTGGHNIIEPAIFGKAILYGSHMENFRQVDELFQQAEAAMVVKSDEAFQGSLHTLMGSESLRNDLGRKARALVEKHRGAIQRTLDIIDAL